jgi:rhodanese-related sulfurtransferase
MGTQTGREVTSKEAAELIRNITPLVLDVRTPGEYSRGHLKDSVLVPVQQLQARMNEFPSEAFVQPLPE